MPDDFYYDWTVKTRAIWREVIAEADPTEGTTKAAAREIAAARIHDLIDSGDLKIPVDTAINAAIEKADTDDGKATDRVLRAVVEGTWSMEYEDDPILDYVVKLGAGRRKPWRHVTQADLIEVEQARYRNMHNAQTAYHDFRGYYDRAFLVLGQHSTFGDAAESGAFIAPEEAA